MVCYVSTDQCDHPVSAGEEPGKRICAGEVDFKMVKCRKVTQIQPHLVTCPFIAQEFPEAVLTQKQKWLPQTCHRPMTQLMCKRVLSVSLPGLLQGSPRWKISEAIHCMLDLYANLLLILTWLLGQWKISNYPGHSKRLLSKSS